MEEIAFAPWLVGLEWWRSAVDAGWRAFEVMTPCPSLERAAVSRCGGVSAALGQTAKQELNALNEQADLAIAAARRASDDIRHEIVGEVAQALAEPLPGADPAPSPARGTAPRAKTTQPA